MKKGNEMTIKEIEAKIRIHVYNGKVNVDKKSGATYINGRYAGRWDFKANLFRYN